MTWLYCFQVGARYPVLVVDSIGTDKYRLSTSIGLPPPIASPQSTKSSKKVMHLAKDVLTPEDRAQVRLLDMLCSAQLHLEDTEDVSAHFALTQTFEAQLDAIRVEFQQNRSCNLETQWQSTKLYVFGMTLIQEGPLGSHHVTQAFVNQQIALEKCLKAASSYITTMTDLSNQSIAGQRYASGILTLYPKHYFNALMAAAAYLFRGFIAFKGATEYQQSWQ